MLLDQEGFECDPINRMEGDTPLHSAIRHINSLDLTPDTANFASALISMMCDAGNDPRIKNKAKLTPYQLTDPSNTKLRQQLMDAVDIMQNQGDFIVAEEEQEDDLDDDYAGSASDSDFDPEEFKKEQARRKEEKERMRAEGQETDGIGQAF